jgi:glyoxylate/hydroxypyruvate reductase
MSVLFVSNEENREDWLREIRAAAPEFQFLTADEVDDPSDVEFAVVARIGRGGLGGYPRLRAILSMWAGVEHLLADPALPPRIPIIRMVEPSLTRGMVEYVCCHVLNILLRTDCYPVKGWYHPQKRQPRFACGFPVGVMGVGVLGGACATALRQLGFPVNGWNRTPKKMPGIEMYSGAGEFDVFLNRSQVLVLLLPNTPETRAILNARSLRQLPPGASIINAGRGELIDDQSLLDVLEQGHLEKAVLDVFSTEPLPDDHPFRGHPKIIVTPHVASITNPKTAADVLSVNLRKLRDHEAVWPVVDRDRGY